MRKGFASVLIVAVVAIAIGVAGVLAYQKFSAKKATSSPNPQVAKATPAQSQAASEAESSQASADKTANWKTFQNNASKFTIKHPENMVPVGVGIGPPEAKDASDVIICSGCTNSVDPVKTPLIYIQTTQLNYTTFKDTAFADIVKQNYDANLANKNSTRSVVKSLQQTTFADEPAFTYTLDSSGYSGKYNGFTTYSGINEITEVQHNGIFYTLISTQDPIFDQILSTFKFTN